MARGPHPWKYSAPSYMRSKAHTLRRESPREKYPKEMKKKSPPFHEAPTHSPTGRIYIRGDREYHAILASITMNRLSDSKR